MVAATSYEVSSVASFTSGRGDATGDHLPDVSTSSLSRQREQSGAEASRSSTRIGKSRTDPLCSASTFSRANKASPSLTSRGTMKKTNWATWCSSKTNKASPPAKRKPTKAESLGPEQARARSRANCRSCDRTGSFGNSSPSTVSEPESPKLLATSSAKQGTTDSSLTLQFSSSPHDTFCKECPNSEAAPSQPLVHLLTCVRSTLGKLC
mmetsp:Transcript_29153/g.77010  ORF Transcript_29153/g.77010 Transcript_29153/m.77010 type:complete len:209 (+) Transcript_29153:359-985(+)